jgi:hypothetical protein
MRSFRYCGMVVVLALIAAGCDRSPAPHPPSPTAAPPEAPAGTGTFGDDLKFLQAYTDIIVLASADGRAQIAIAPGFQGRVMTSTATGTQGPSFGYVHRPVIVQRARQPHMTVLGGEDRLWLGPEGGQFGLYFPPGAAFTTDQWQVPEPIDWGAWPVVVRNTREVMFVQPMTLTNYAGTRFTVRVDRTIRLLDRPAVANMLGPATPAVHVVAYESDNYLVNAGTESWRRETGLLSIWILGMLQPAPRTTVVIPFRSGPGKTPGPVVNDEYFGVQPPNRLRIGETAVFFRGDGRHRGKIGIPKPRARNVAGSYDPDGRVLTLVQFTLPAGPQPYVNSMWAHQDDPYAGDVINSYNDGPLAPGQPPLGPFYELESSSPAAALVPNGSIRHIHRTLHLQGPQAELDAIAKRVLGVTLAEIVQALP